MVCFKQLKKTYIETNDEVDNSNEGNPKDSDGETPLHYAAMKGNFQVTLMLLKK